MGYFNALKIGLQMSGRNSVIVSSEAWNRYSREGKELRVAKLGNIISNFTFVCTAFVML
jgi:hypothetical protein